MSRKVLVTGSKIVAVCFVFAVSFVVGGALSGLNKAGQEPPAAATVQQLTPALPAARPGPNSEAQAEEIPGLLALAIFSLWVGIVVSYLVLRSSWHGWLLVGAISLGIYGISTVATQIETWFFLSDKLPRGLIGAIFLQGAISTLLFAPLAVLILGKWRAGLADSRPVQFRAPFTAWRLALIVFAFVFLYMFFGYYVAWQNPVLREYYGGPEYRSLYAALQANWMNHRSIYAIQVLRAFLYAACLYPLIRMLRVARWETALAMALFASAWTTVLLLPNPLMPATVAHTHFRETLGFSLVFGALAGCVLYDKGEPLSARRPMKQRSLQKSEAH